MFATVRRLLCLLILLVSLGLPCLAKPSPYDEGFELYLNGQFEQALKSFKQARSERDDGEVRLWIGWSHYRLGEIKEAKEAFQASLKLRADHPEALAGLGFVALRDARNQEARELFLRSLEKQPESTDALLGISYVAYRQDRPTEARDYLKKLLAIDPENGEAKVLFSKVEDIEEPEKAYPARVPLVRPEKLQLGFRCGKKYFEVRDGDRWVPTLLHGVNLGAALPGHHPSEFPQARAFYAQWLQEMANMGANVVRVYTVLPPGFYQAFWDYHQNPKNPPLYIMHGVWTELPEDANFLNPEFLDGFVDEIRDVVDLLHGQADIPRRPGHAWGSYSSDVSPWVIGYILGREWEPYSVVRFHDLHPDYRFVGRYFSAPEGNTAENWMAMVCDVMAAYEMDKYHAQRPSAFTNWPTLDPLHHDSETTKDEEIAILAKRGIIRQREIREYDNDAVGITATNLKTSAEFPAGMFASYHAYPYYPDFMVNEPSYAEAVGPHGPSNYMGYLLELKAHYKDMPLLISEYGVPSSRGDAHVQPQGYDHGGHTELAQGEIDVKLTDEILAAGCAGGIVFAWIDEWFKKNWAVIDVEIPLERNRLWLNVLDAEQNYGMIAMRPGKERLFSTLSGIKKEWSEATLMARSEEPDRPLKALYAGSDEAYLYLRLDIGGEGLIDFTKQAYAIAIDTFDPELGDHRLPPDFGIQMQQGVEFLIMLGGPDKTRLLVTEDYDAYKTLPIRGIDGEVSRLRDTFISTRDVSKGVFVPYIIEANRLRVGRDGTIFPGIPLEWGKLRRGSLNPKAPDFSSLSDWNVSQDSRIIEVRIPWGLLNVTDPSEHRVIQDLWDDGETETAITDGFRFLAVAYKPSQAETPVRVVDVLPKAQTQPYPLTDTFHWPTWERPEYHWEFKEAYYQMQKRFQSLRGIQPHD